jgi:hypothetical protein
MKGHSAVPGVQDVVLRRGGPVDEAGREEVATLIVE